MDLHQKPGDRVIETGAELMKHFTRNDAQPTGVQFASGMSDGVCKMSRLRVKLGAEYVRIETFELSDRGVQLSDVLCGPV